MTAKPTLCIFSDWDETITNHDTLSLIAPPDSSDLNGPPPLSYFSEYYSNLIAAHKRWFGARDTLERQLNYLGSLTPVEKASIEKIEENGLFKGVRGAEICKRAQQVQFREGWNEFTEYVTGKNHVRLMGILSVNWSKLFINCALRRIHDDAFMAQIEIWANVCLLEDMADLQEVEMDSDGKGTGIISKGDEGIYTGYDKWRKMKRAIAERPTSDSITMVYVGDSDTDLPCLLYAEIGIIMGEGSSLIETCNAVGIKVERNPSLREIGRRGDEKEVLTLYHFQDWRGIISSGLLE